MNRAFRAIRRSDVVALVIEALACITEQVLFLQLLWSNLIYNVYNFWLEILALSALFLFLHLLFD